MSGPVEVPEVERLREQVRRLEEREAGLSALLLSCTGQIGYLRSDLDSEIMERAAMRVRADRDRMTIDVLTRSAEARRLRVGAIVQIAKPPPGRQPWRGVVVFLDVDTERAAPSVLVWWIDPIKPADVLATPEWASRADLTVIG